MRLTRRSLLVGSLTGATTLAAAGVVPSTRPGPMVSGAFRSAARGGIRTGWSISYPPGSSPGDALPVVVVLHGSGSDHRSAFGAGLGLDRFLASAVRGGAAPFAIAAVDGGETYWHHRTSGEDAGAMVIDEFLPLLTRRGLDTARLGLHGWSMGGYGALLLASRLGAGRVSAVVAESPALWHRLKDAESIAFDGPKDFARNSLFGRQSELDGIPVRIDCGTADDFCPAVRDYVAGFTHPPRGGFERGGHTGGFWQRMAPAQLAFLARRL